MGKRYKAVGARCPYYCSEGMGKIYCDGFQPGQYTHVAFGNDTERRKFETEYCKRDWQKCIYARMHEEGIE